MASSACIQRCCDSLQCCVPSGDIKVIARSWRELGARQTPPEFTVARFGTTPPPQRRRNEGSLYHTLVQVKLWKQCTGRRAHRCATRRPLDRSKGRHACSSPNERSADVVSPPSSHLPVVPRHSTRCISYLGKAVMCTRSNHHGSTDDSLASSRSSAGGL